MIERTFDYSLVEKMAQWKPVFSSKFIYLIDNGLNLWAFREYLDGLLICSGTDLDGRGKWVIESIRASFKWIFGNTDTSVIYAAIPTEEKGDCCKAVKSGMKFKYTKEKLDYYEVRGVEFLLNSI